MFLKCKKKLRNSVRHIWYQVFKIHIKLWIFKREWNRIAIVFFSDCSLIRCNPFSIFFIFVVVLSRSVVCSWGVQDQYSWCGLPKVVCFLRGSRSLLWCVVFCNLVWLLSGLPSGFRELDVALVVRVNQYKLFVCFSLSLNSFKFCF